MSSTVLCAFLYFTVLMVVNTAFSPEVGYRVTQTKSDGTTEVVQEYLYKDGEDASLEVQLEDGQKRVPVKGDISKGTTTTANAILLVAMLITVGVFPYNAMWNLGSNDENKVKFGRKKKDVLRGLKIGALATVPSVALFIALILSRCGIINPAYFSVYRLFNLPFLPYINWVAPTTSAAELTWISLLLIALTLFFIPAVCTTGYLLGYHDFSIGERLIYQKKSKKMIDEEI